MSLIIYPKIFANETFHEELSANSKSTFVLTKSDVAALLHQMEQNDLLLLKLDVDDPHAIDVSNITLAIRKE